MPPARGPSRSIRSNSTLRAASGIRFILADRASGCVWPHRVLPTPPTPDRYLPAPPRRSCAMIDPADANRCEEVFNAKEDELARLCQRHPRLTTVLCTHKHWDHAGGNKALQKHFPELTIHTGWRDRSTAFTHLVREGDVVHVGETAVHVLETPCHTRVRRTPCIHRSFPRRRLPARTGPRRVPHLLPDATPRGGKPRPRLHGRHPVCGWDGQVL